ncbi:type I glyceraldehyde-3-phosphate dehydrogenase [Rhodobacteraceae bacterium]|nr:type I glyceraldehyde-3-phosphate dehydrogenase [Paracoccaceae bacterium]
MAVRVGINGFGRIGRNILRAIIENKRTDISVVAINDLGPVATSAHLLKFDSIHGKFPNKITVTEDTIDVGTGPIRVTAIGNPEELPWNDIDIAFECTGIFNEKEIASKHLKNGSKRVLVSAPCKNADKTIVFGVNHKTLSKNDLVVSNASCTTNCLVPVVKVLHEELGVKRGFMTTIHSYTGDQPTLDTMHSDLYRSRAAAMNMIPTSTGAARAVGLVIPELNGKLDGVSIRVPTPNVSVVDLTFESLKETSESEINFLIKNSSFNELKGILSYTEEKLVSMDFNHDPHSSIFAADQTKVLEKKMVRVLSWYDNEWGFSNRMSDTALEMASLF